MPGQSLEPGEDFRGCYQREMPWFQQRWEKPNASAVFRQLLTVMLPGAAMWDQLQPDHVRGVREPAWLPLGVGKPHVWVPEVRAGRRRCCSRLWAPRRAALPGRALSALRRAALSVRAAAKNAVNRGWRFLNHKVCVYACFTLTHVWRDLIELKHMVFWKLAQLRLQLF